MNILKGDFIYMSSGYQLYHDVYTLTSLYQHYAPEIERVFYYLNGKVNQLNKCQLVMGYYSPINFACFRYPNYVIVYVGSLIDVFCDRENPRDMILSIASLTIAHELLHADQCIDARQYKVNADYCNNIENSAEYNAEIWCYAHKQDFKRELGFNYVLGVGKTTGIYKRHNDTFVSNMLLGTFRSDVLVDLFNKTLQENENVGVRVVDLNGQSTFFIAKLHGNIDVSEDSLYALAKVLRLAVPNPNAYQYTLELSHMHGENKELGIDDMKVLNIQITEMTYNPFPFN